MKDLRQLVLAHVFGTSQSSEARLLFHGLETCGVDNFAKLEKLTIVLTA